MLYYIQALEYNILKNESVIKTKEENYEEKDFGN
jgi:hypothetical protein